MIERKQTDELARVFSDHARRYGGPNAMNEHAREALESAADDVARVLANACPEFDRARFLKGCKPKPFRF